MVVHHLLIDVVSWRILMDDINVGLANISDGIELDLGFKTTSIQQWGSALVEYSQTNAVLDKLEYWRTLSNLKYTVLPMDNHSLDNTYGQINEYVASLDIGQTKKLLSHVNGAYRTDIEDVLLSALAMTISQWASDVEKGRGVHRPQSANAPGKVYLQLESHGRENISTSVDVTGTLGWFTSVFPVLLDIDEIDLTNPNNYGTLIQSVKEQMRQVGAGDGGFSFSLLRYMSEDEVSQQLLSIPTPEIVFNYLGQLD
ncbi:MAG: hypothetical protein KUG73_11305, partial [Pseudomonadales bacterium]|nr:hypothetical protein [Pseudomonadales bacterium]